jgi:hypothetical protein
VLESPHPTHIPRIAVRRKQPRSILHFRRRAGKPNNKSTAKVAPPPAKKPFSGINVLRLSAALTAVSIAVTAVAPLTVTEEEEVPPLPSLQVTASAELLAVVFTAQERATLPVKPPDGVIVIVEVFPLVAPELMVIFPLLLSTKLGAATAFTTAEADPVALL